MWSYRDYSKYGSGGGGPVVIPPEAGNLTGIIITQNPTKTDYIEGESIVLDGLEVTATYDNDVRGIVTGACEIVVNDPLTVTDTTVTVNYEGFTTTFPISIYGKNLEIPANTTLYMHFEGDLKDEISGNTVGSTSGSVMYPAGKFGKSLNASNYSAYNLGIGTCNEITTGAKNATLQAWFNFSGKTTSSYVSDFLNFPSTSIGGEGAIMLQNNQIISDGFAQDPSLSNNKNTRKYTLPNGFFNTAWHHIAIVFYNGTKNIYVDGKKALSYGANTSYSTNNGGLVMSSIDLPCDELLVSAEALYTDDFEVPTNIYGGIRTLQKIYMEEKPTKTIYQSGEMFSLDGAAIKAVFSDGTIMDVTSDCTIVETTPITLSDKFRTISYTYEGVTKKLYINVGAYTIEPTLDLSSTVLLMPFDGSSADLNGHEITNTGDEYYSSIEQGKFGQARYFNGATDYLSTPYTQDLNIDSGDFTISFWAKVSSRFQVLISTCKLISSDTPVGLRIGTYEDGTLFCTASIDASGTPLVISNMEKGLIKFNEWQHIALVRKGNEFALYIDGKKNNYVEYNGTIYNLSSLLIIGAREKYQSGIESYIDGYIDDLIITKSALWDGEFIPPTKPFSKIS